MLGHLVVPLHDATVAVATALLAELVAALFVGDIVVVAIDGGLAAGLG